MTGWAKNCDIDLLVVLDELAPSDRARLMGEIRFGIRAPMAIDVFVTDVEECERRKDVVGSMHYLAASQRRGGL